MSHFSPLLFSAIQRIAGYDRQVIQWWWLILAVVALMFLLACWRISVWTILWLRKPAKNPKSLLKSLERLHRLSAKERKLILGLASKLPLKTPAAILFADPSRWAWKQVEDQNTIASLEKLYVKIFGFPRDHHGN